MRVHFIGIGGIGLSALARFLNFDGHSVSGSDVKSSPIIKELINEGIKISCPQDAKNITKDLDLVIYSAAVTDENPELIEARLKQIRTLSRKEALPIILGDKKKPGNINKINIKVLKEATKIFLLPRLSLILPSLGEANAIITVGSKNATPICSKFELNLLCKYKTKIAETKLFLIIKR